MVVLLAPISMADDPPEVATKSELGPTIPRFVVRPGQVPSGLKMPALRARARFQSFWFMDSGDSAAMGPNG